VMPLVEQMRSERYRVGQRLKVYLLEVARTGKGPRVVVSRSHPNLLRRLFELETPEVFSGAVEIKSVAREAGYRSKVAVAARQDGIDPVGCCVGLRGIRIQNIVSELNGEKIDVVRWDPDASVFIANALSPAQILRVDLDEGNGVATVIVPDKQLSLAIGKEGQNARLATKLTGWRIDIKSVSVDEAEKAEAAKLLVETEGEAAGGEELLGETLAVLEPALVLAEVPAAETAEPLLDVDTTFIPPRVPSEPKVTVGKPKIRFAEDILISTPPKPGAKPKKKKKKGAQGKEGAEDGIRLKRTRRVPEIVDDDEEE
jgi:transcription termination/antitermination protein NusA